MSRIGRRLIKIPDKVEVTISDTVIKVKGEKGELEQEIHPNVVIEKSDEGVRVSVKDPENHKDRALWGLYNSLVNNMIEGVSEGFKKELEINGVGYKAAVSGQKLTLNVGFSHPVDFEIPKNIEVKVEKNIITITGISKELVGQVAANIRAVKPPEPYKGKGIKYVDERIIKKAGKQAATTEGA